MQVLYDKVMILGGKEFRDRRNNLCVSVTVVIRTWGSWFASPRTVTEAGKRSLSFKSKSSRQSPLLLILILIYSCSYDLQWSPKERVKNLCIFYKL